VPFRPFYGEGAGLPRPGDRVRAADEERRRRREAELRSFDQRIGEEVEAMRRSGELRRLPGYGKPLPEIEGWAETPGELRLPFRILKNAGVVPPEVELFHRRAALRRQLDECRSAPERAGLEARLTEIEQVIALRLEALRSTRSL
jgi:hypothetical protein